jgi:GGDEF domain-containing protein
MTPRRESPSRSPAWAAGAAVLLTIAIALLDWVTGYEVSVLALYLLPPALAGWHGGRRAAIALSLLGTGAWLWADLFAGHPYSHPGIPYWNSVPRLAIFAAFGVLAAELRKARERAERGLEEDGMPAAGSFYRMLEQEHARLLRYGRPVTLAYVDAGGVRSDPGAGTETFTDAVLDVLRATLRATDVIARPRGKEFALLLADTGPEAAAVALERLRRRLAELAARQGTGSVVMGAVSCATPTADLNHVIQRAYQLMYQAERTPGEVTLSLEGIAEALAGAVSAR